MSQTATDVYKDSRKKSQSRNFFFLLTLNFVCFAKHISKLEQQPTEKSAKFTDESGWAMFDRT